jgi:hypothetical protein
MRWLKGVAFMAILGTIVGLGQSGAGASPLVPAVTSGVPLAPTSVSASQNGPSADITISWTAWATGGPSATGAIVQLYILRNGTFGFVSDVVCGAPCTSSDFRGLAFGSTYEGRVYLIDDAGPGVPLQSAPVTPTTACPVSACVTLNATAPIGSANRAASGILSSVFNVGNVIADMAALGTTMFRSSPTYNPDGSLNWTNWNVATRSGARTTLVLSDLWSAAHGGNPPTPWSDWSGYSAWVTSTVSTIVASGEPVNYWEVYNEPGGAGYYSAGNYATETPALLLQQFLVTYQAIKAADDAAAIIGPSLAEWSDIPNQDGTAASPDPSFDMVSFLEYAAANHLQLAAVSWHEIAASLGPNPSDNSVLPATIEGHVAEARRLIASLPALGNPQIFINEYGLPEVQVIPGWDVAYLSALTTAQVDSAGRACWPGTACANPTLDGLLANDGVSTTPDYWVRTIYASLSGNTVATTSTNDFVTALGSFDPTSNAISGLVGRGEGCTQDAFCAQALPTDTPQAPISTLVTVTVPWTAGTVSVTLIDIPGQSLAPIFEPHPTVIDTTISPASATSGTITVSIPAFADGDAYGIKVTPIVVTSPGTTNPPPPPPTAGAGYYGSTGNIHLNKPIVGMARTPDGRGYWLVASDGGIFTFGDARYYGSTGNLRLNKPIVGMARTPDGKGYWLVASDGGIFAFGDAGYHGSTGNLHLNKPIVGMAASASGGGYWLAASDGGIFAFGDAGYFGSAGNHPLNRPVVGLAATADGKGYWLVASDGGIFTFGDAGYFGSTGSVRLNRPIVGIAPTFSGQGYDLAASDGGIFTFGDAPYIGSTGGDALNEPIVGLATTATGYLLVASDGGIFTFGTG